MSLPNFFVIGPQKCGTTALYHALRQHPQIYMSPIKETRFFAFVGKRPNFCGPGDETSINSHTITNLADYMALYAGTEAFPAIGEATPLYLSAYQPEQTAQRIADLVPQARIIAILRQPAERAWSGFLHLHKMGVESQRNFRTALAQEEARIQANWSPQWYYRRNGEYDRTLAPYLARFGRERVRIYLYDEWDEQPARVMQEIFRFLEVDEHFQPDLTQRHNVSWMPRSTTVRRLLRSGGRLYRTTARFLPARLHGQLFARLNTWNQVRPTFSPELRSQLTVGYTPSIHRLEKMIDRDLSPWLQV